jgi:hypothetical protein
VAVWRRDEDGEPVYEIVHENIRDVDRRGHNGARSAHEVAAEPMTATRPVCALCGRIFALVMPPGEPEEEWTKDDAEKALAAKLLGVSPEAPAAPIAGMAFGVMVEKFLDREAQRGEALDQGRRGAEPAAAGVLR